MASLFDYLDWRGDLEFSKVPLGEVDNAILSQLSFIDYAGIVPAGLDSKISLTNAAKQYLRARKGEAAYIGAFVPAATVSLLAKAAKSKRFGQIYMTGYINHIDPDKEVQFSAVTYILDDDHIFVAFRGTDDSLIGWKENFNMTFMHPIPAQTEALAYLDTVAEHFKGKKIYVGGHSKGGNLAVYSAVKSKSSTKEQIERVYNNDGPGFERSFIESLDYINMRDKIRIILPQASVIGMLLEHEDNYEVIKSNQSGLMQHDILSWEVLGNKFIRLNTVTKESKFIDATLKHWLNEMSPEERERFVDSLFEAFATTNATTLTELTSEKLNLFKIWGTLNDETKSLLLKSIKIYIRERSKILRQAKGKK